MVARPGDSPPCEADDEPVTCACSERVAVLEAQVAVLYASLRTELSRVSLFQCRMLDSNMHAAAIGAEVQPTRGPHL